jgi:predicted RNA binding protein YcfA (HicA-like mRNA interferase family)
MPISGKEAVKILEKHGFSVQRQRGSHIVVAKITASGRLTAIVPDHKELRKGTIASIARQSNLDKKLFGI